MTPEDRERLERDADIASYDGDDYDDIVMVHELMAAAGELLELLNQAD